MCIIEHIDDLNKVGKPRGEAKSESGSRSRRHLKLLEDISNLIGRTPDAQESLEGVVRLLAAAMDCEVCSLYSYDPDSETLSLAATHGLQARSIGRIVMSKSEGLAGLSAEKQEPVVVEDALAHPRFKFFPETGEERYHGFLGVPVGEGLGLLGVLVLQSRRRRRFGAEEISVVRQAAAHVRGIMLNAKLSESLQREEHQREHYRRGMMRAIERLEAYEAAEQAASTEATEEESVHLSG